MLHFVDFLDNLDENEGLGLSPEQTGESKHHAFLKIWKIYEMNVIVDSRYGKRLKAAVNEFSSVTCNLD